VRKIYLEQFVECATAVPAAMRGEREFTAGGVRNFTRAVYRAVTLAHDPEKWGPVFGKDHAQAKC
jgi:hypothetical protein